MLQVDDSPRYAALGRWEHSGGVSTWISDETWRPLPRREFSVRKDYDVLVGTNRHTITPTGWVQEENNLKLALKDRKYLAREYGVARYQRIKDYDFGAGEKYYTRTEPFWAEVRAAWRELEEGAAASPYARRWTRRSSSCRSSGTPTSWSKARRSIETTRAPSSDAAGQLPEIEPSRPSLPTCGSRRPTWRSRA